MQRECIYTETCPIFKGILQNRTISSSSYKAMYCTAGEYNWKKCKRYLVKKQFDTCPAEILPNTALSVAQIADRYRLG